MTAPTRTQGGAATLIVTLTLCVALLLATLYANRALLFEARLAAHQQHATLAFEAAEAGLEWAQAQLNSPALIGNDCLPAASGTQSFRERYLAFDPASVTHTASTATPSCERAGSGWRCNCPASGASTLVAAPGTAAAPAFSLRLLPGSQPGLVRLRSTGCAGLAGACVAGSTQRVDASTVVEVELGLVPGLRQPPRAALTVRGSVSVGNASLGAHNTEAASGGVAIHAGAAVDAPQVRLSAPTGQPTTSALRANDASLAALSGEQLFVAHFGLPKARWRAMPGVTVVGCGLDCGTALGAAVAAGRRLLWVDGDVDLQGPLTLGTAEQPVLLVAQGAVRLRGAVVLNGVVHAARTDWNEAAPGAKLHGALVSETDHAGDAAPDLHHDAAVLTQLGRNSGAFARVPGSWRDF